MMVTIFTLLKVFSRLDYAEQMRAGSLRFSTLRYFRGYEDATPGERRGDRDEGISHWL